MASCQDVDTLHFKIIADDHFDKGNFREASVFYSKAIQCDPRNYKLFGNRSLCNFNLQKYSDALKDAEEALRLTPNYMKGHVRKFQALYKLNRTGEADEAFAEATDKFPEFGEDMALVRDQTLHANFNLANCLVSSVASYFCISPSNRINERDSDAEEVEMEGEYVIPGDEDVRTSEVTKRNRETTS